MKALCVFLREQDGQDLIEYTLLVAFVVLGCLILLRIGGGSIEGIWNKNKTNLRAADTFSG